MVPSAHRRKKQISNRRSQSVYLCLDCTKAIDTPSECFKHVTEFDHLVMLSSVTFWEMKEVSYDDIENIPVFPI